MSKNGAHVKMFKAHTCSILIAFDNCSNCSSLDLRSERTSNFSRLSRSTTSLAVISAESTSRFLVCSLTWYWPIISSYCFKLCFKPATWARSSPSFSCPFCFSSGSYNIFWSFWSDILNNKTAYLTINFELERWIIIWIRKPMHV